MLEKNVRDDMITALKSNNISDKTTLGSLVNALALAAKDNKAPLTTEQEGAVVLKLCKQIKETIDTCPPNRIDLLDKAKHELELISKYAPKQMDEDEIRITIQGVLADIGIDNPTAKDKGIIMKNLMPKTKGKADGKLVNEILASMMS